MAWYLQVVDGLVRNVWDSPPPVPVGQDGWMDAVQDIPVVNFDRYELGDWIYNVESSPAVISREVKEIPLDQRKAAKIQANETKYFKFIDLLAKAPALFDETEIADNKAAARANKAAIEACVSHDQLDALSLQEITLF